VDVQAAAQAASSAHNVSDLANVKDDVLQSIPPSQGYQTPSDTALLRSTFPQMLLTFTEAEAVRLMLLGLRDADAIDCVTHGFGKNSTAAASQLNPVDAVFRMAADMSGCFTSPRSLAIQGVYVKSKSHSFPFFSKTTRSVCIMQQAGAALPRNMSVT
jgi:hypothetical protein